MKIPYQILLILISAVSLYLKTMEHQKYNIQLPIDASSKDLSIRVEEYVNRLAQDIFQRKGTSYYKVTCACHDTFDARNTKTMWYYYDHDTCRTDIFLTPEARLIISHIARMIAIDHAQDKLGDTISYPYISYPDVPSCQDVDTYLEKIYLNRHRLRLHPYLIHKQALFRILDNDRMISSWVYDPNPDTTHDALVYLHHVSPNAYERELCARHAHMFGLLMKHTHLPRDVSCIDQLYKKLSSLREEKSGHKE